MPNELGTELKKDKYLLFGLVVILLAVYVLTRDVQILTLLTGVVGGLLTLATRPPTAATTATTATGDVTLNQPAAPAVK